MTKALDSALFIPPNPNAGELIEIASPGPPLKTQYGNYISAPPGVTVEASVPAATGEGQSLVSGPAPDFAWTPVVTASDLPEPTGPGQTYVSANDAPFAMQLAAATPQATAPSQVLVSGGSLGPFPWTLTTVAALMAAGNAVTTSGGGAFVPAATLVFTAAGNLSTRMDGIDPTKSAIDNFTIDAGTF